MFEKAQMVFMHCQTPLHAGSGGGVGFIDLPIQREVQNDFPTIYGSGIKGAIKAWCRGADGSLTKEMKALFGADVAAGEGAYRESDDHNSALSFTDARILAFPVKSLNGLFAWVTCPLALAKYRQDLNLVFGNGANAITPEIPVLEAGECQTSSNSCLKVHEEHVVLEDSVFHVEGHCDGWRDELSNRIFGSEADTRDYWKTKFDTSLVVLSDQDFGDFVTRSTQVAPRIRIDFETGRVERGALWYEECLPADTILYTLALAGRPTRQPYNTEDVDWVMDQLRERVLTGDPCLQFGGDETVGKGLVKLIAAKEEVA